MLIRYSFRKWLNSHMPDFVFRFQNRHRTHDKTIIIMVNSKVQVPLDLLDHLKKVHPRMWYDDEMDGLFFATYDYLTRNMKYVVKLKHHRNSDLMSAFIQDKIFNKEYKNYEPTDQGEAYLLIKSYRYFIKYGSAPVSSTIPSYCTGTYLRTSEYNGYMYMDSYGNTPQY